MNYHTGEEVRVGDHITWHLENAKVESLHSAAELRDWDCEEKEGFMILVESAGRVLINPGSFDWEDVEFVSREGGC